MNRMLWAVASFSIIAITPSFAVAGSVNTSRRAVLDTVASEMHFFSTNDQNKYLKLFSEDAVVLDDTTPFSFKGVSAIAGWFAQSHAGLHTVTISPGEPRDIEIAKDRAFAVVPFTFAGTDMKDKTFAAKGYLTVQLVHVDAGWRIRYLIVSVTG